jgi:glycosyltransferase involved in cell wall biosynthesis
MKAQSRALLITPTSPWAKSFGAQQRSRLMFDSLSELMPADVLLLEEAKEDSVTSGDRPEIVACLTWSNPRFAFYRYRVNEWCDGWCNANIDWSRYSLVAGRYITPITKIGMPRHVKTVVDCDDAYYRYPPGAAAVASRATALAKGYLRRVQTQTAVRRFDHAFFCTARDRDLFECRSSSVLPNVVGAPAEPPAHPDREAGTALVVGSMWYAPNRQGIDWFLANCWPAIAERCPDLSLRIVGPAPAAERARWERFTRTEAPGFVDDLAAEYSRALFAVAPVHYGGGTCIKFLESAAFCRSCVVTRYVFEGFKADFTEGQSVVVARDAPSMIDGCVLLYSDAKRRRAIAELAYETTRSRYTVSRFKDVVQQAVKGLLS